MSKPKETGVSVLWDRETTITFCNLCLREAELGNRPTTHFSKEGWQNLNSKFKEVTGKNYDHMKLKNMWDQLKKEWQFWKELKRGSTGLGWDPLKRTIDAPESWWAERLQVVPAAKKFKLSCIDPFKEEKLDDMFTEFVTTAAYAFTPNDQGFDRLPLNMETEHIGESGEGPSQINTDVQSTGWTKPPRVEKKKRGVAFLRGTIETILQSCKARFEPSKENSIKECIKLLNTYPGVMEDKVMYLKYVKLLGNSNRRHFLESLDPEFQLDYLRSFMKN